MKWIKVSEALPETGRFVLAYFQNDLGMDRIIRAQYSDGHNLEVSEMMDWNGDWAKLDSVKKYGKVEVATRKTLLEGKVKVLPMKKEGVNENLFLP